MTTRIMDNGITVLTPSDGMRLTDGKTVAYGEVYIGGNDSPSKWTEIAKDEAEAIIAEAEHIALADADAIRAYDSMRDRAEVAEALASLRGQLIQSEAERLREEKLDIEEKIASDVYIVIRPWLRLKLASVDAAIKKMDEQVA